MNIKTVTCPNCGSTLDLNFDNLQKYCSACGSKLMLDIDTIQQLLIEKEKTKQVQIQETAKTEVAINEQKLRSKKMIIGLIAVGMWMIFVIVALIATGISGGNVMFVLILLMMFGLLIVVAIYSFFATRNRESGSKS